MSSSAKSLENLKAPLILTPRADSRVWGGRRVSELFGRVVPEGPVGESWEIYGELPVASGPFKGRSLDSLVAEFGCELLGRRGEPERGFPLLTKWLDCKGWLSVQIHPDDALALELTGSPKERGKSEAWYVARRDDDAKLIHGLKKGVDPTHAVRLRDEGLLEVLNFMTPDQGELLYTPAGVVHALGPGFLIYEVQQSSDLTYRFYDWGRDREIHLTKAGRCLLEAESPPAKQTEEGLYCPYFSIEMMSQNERWTLAGDSFEILACVEGAATLKGAFGQHDLNFGDTVLLPADLGEVTAELREWGRLLSVTLGKKETV